MIIWGSCRCILESWRLLFYVLSVRGGRTHCTAIMVHVVAVVHVWFVRVVLLELGDGNLLGVVWRMFQSRWLVLNSAAMLLSCCSRKSACF